MDIKKKIIGVGILSVISLVVALSSLNSNTKSKEDSKPNIENTDKTISTEDDIIKEDKLPNELSEEKQIIWIKNLTFLTSKDETFDTIMTLKSKLNTELKTLNSEIYEVNLLEDTYEKTDNGFEIEATADKLDGKIIIEYNNHEFIFTIVES